MSTDTIQRQAPVALLALVQHINDQGLGAPLQISMPSTACPFFSLVVASFSLPVWLESGYVVDHVETRPHPGRIAGRAQEFVVHDGRLEALGIRVRITSVRRAYDGPRLVEGTAS